MKMASKYRFSSEEIDAIKEARRVNKDKRADARLKALELRAEGMKAKEVSQATGFHAAYVTTLVAIYREKGLEYISGNHYGGNRRNMSFEEHRLHRIFCGLPKYCWCEKGVRPNVPCHHIREYRYAYGAVEPLTGESCFLVLPYCDTACMNLFLQELSNQFPEDTILLCCDGAAWHKSRALELPDNIVIFHIPPYTPEMNPIEQIWKEIRKRGFRNEVFATLEKVVDRLCDTICALTADTISSITGRKWIIKVFN